VIVPIKVIELYKISPENHKSITIYKAIRANGSEPPPLYIIIPGKKIIET
jgi:hypothetical protein